MAKKAEAPSKEPKVSIPKETKKLLEQALAKLVEHHGPHVFPDERDLVDHLVFAVLSERAPVTNARKAMRELRDTYVDWNETRVATARELAALLETHRFPEAFDAAKALRQSLQGTFDALYTLDIGVLAEPDSERGKGSKKRLDKASALAPYVRDYLLLLANVSAQAPLGPVSARVLERLGLFAADDPEPKKRAVLAALGDRTEALRLHHMLVEHAKKVCTEADPKCARCPLLSQCAFGAEQEKAGKKGARAKSPASPAGKPGAAKTSGRAKAEDGGATAKAKPKAAKPKAAAAKPAKDGAAKPRAKRS